jgi:hypothetical protein
MVMEAFLLRLHEHLQLAEEIGIHHAKKACHIVSSRINISKSSSLHCSACNLHKGRSEARSGKGSMRFVTVGIREATTV